MARPKKEISQEDMARAEELALMNCNNNTICQMLGWNHSFIEDRPDILKRLRKKRAEHKAAIRDSQWNQRNNATMAIWLGKNSLGQTDKQQLKHGVNSETATLLKMIDGKTAGVLPSQETGGKPGANDGQR